MEEKNKKPILDLSKAMMDLSNACRKYLESEEHKKMIENLRKLGAYSTKANHHL